MFRTLFYARSSLSQWKILTKIPPYDSSSKAPNFHGHFFTSTTKGINFHGCSSISTAKGASFHGHSSISRDKGVNFHGSSSNSRAKCVNFHGSSLIFRAKGINFPGSSSILRAKGVSFHGSYLHSSAFYGKVESYKENVLALYKYPIVFSFSQFLILGLGILTAFCVENKLKVLTFFLLGSGIHCITFYFLNLETVPYTQRSRFVLPLFTYEKVLSEITRFQVEIKFGVKKISASHPCSKIDSIYQTILGSLEAQSKQAWTNLNRGETKSKSGYEIHREAKGLCYIDDIDWKLLVADDDVCELYNFVPSVYPGGIILLPSDVLKVFSSDSEIAFLVAHEVAHAISRHFSESFTREFWLRRPIRILTFGLFTKKLISLRRPSEHMMEHEADDIATLLMAHAGYDPGAAIEVFEKFSKLEDIEKEETSTHPSFQKRIEMLSKSKVMEEALKIFRDNKSKCVADDAASC